MPLFTNKPSSVDYQWHFQTTRLASSNDPSFSHLEAASNAELNRIRDFVAYKNMQIKQSRADMDRLSSHTGRIILPPVRQKISPDKLGSSPVNHFVGKDWPSLRHDFGVHHPENDARSAEFRINFEVESKIYFPVLDPLYRHFTTLGHDADDLQELLLDMKQTDSEILNQKINPHPKDVFGRKLKVDFEGSQLRQRNMIRYRYQYNFNKLADEKGIYIHIRFESQNQYSRDRSAFNQDLVFTFPTSNEERDIWRHVFWNEEYPEAGFPVETDYARQLAALESNGHGRTPQVDKLAEEFSRMPMPGQPPPPSYDARY